MVFGVPMKIISTCRNGQNGCTLIGVFETKRETRADEQQTPAERTQGEPSGKLNIRAQACARH